MLKPTPLVAWFRKATILFTLFTMILSNAPHAYAAEGETVEAAPADSSVSAAPETGSDSALVPAPVLLDAPGTKAAPKEDFQISPQDDLSVESDQSKDISKIGTDLGPHTDSLIGDFPQASDPAIKTNDPLMKSGRNLSAVNRQDGAMTYTYPLTLPPGRLGMTPDLALTYSSYTHNQSENLFGNGWNVSIPHIDRLTREGADNIYSTTTFQSSIAGDLSFMGGTEYGARFERGDFDKYFYASSVWMVKTKTGVMYTYGATDASRISDPGNTSHIFSWYLSEVRDPNGNYISYTYSKDEGQLYPSHITYTHAPGLSGIFDVSFITESRPDQEVSYASAFGVTTTMRIARIEVSSQSALARKYDLAYVAGDNATTTLLHSITETGYDTSSTATALPATVFSYQTHATSWTTNTDPTKWNYPTFDVWNQGGRGIAYMDVNGDGLTDIVSSRFHYEDYSWIGNNPQPNSTSSVMYVFRTFINTGTGWTEDAGWNMPVPILDWAGRDYGMRFADIDNDGLIDILCDGPNKWIGDPTSGSYSLWQYVFRNTGSGWTWDQSYHAPIAFVDTSFNDTGARIVDVNGDGLPDILRSTGTNYAGVPIGTQTILNIGKDWNTQDTTWNLTAPIFPWFNINESVWQTTPTVFFVDLNGDGLQDILWESSYNRQDGGGGATVTGFFHRAYLNTGHGWRNDDSYAAPVMVGTAGYIDSTGPTSLWTSNGGAIVDVNGDGLSDLLTTKITWDLADPSMTSTTVSTVQLNTGHGWSSNTVTLPANLVVNAGQVLGSGYRNHLVDGGVRAVDFDGDGLPDIVDQTSVKMHIISTGLADALNGVTMPTGAVTAVHYQPVGWNMANTSTHLNPLMPSSQMSVVSQITTTDSGNVVASSSYAYEGGYNYLPPIVLWDKTFAGFSKVTSTDALSVKTTYYHQGNGTNASQGEYADAQSKIGRPYREEVRNTAGALLATDITKWDVVTSTVDSGEYRQRYFVKPVQEVSMAYEGDASHKDMAMAQTFDVMGNPATTTQYGEVTAGADGAFTDTGSDLHTRADAYAVNASGTVSGFIARSTEFDGSTQVKDAKYYYDGSSLGSVTKGNQTKVEAWKTSSSYINAQKAYNGYGLVATSTDPRGKITTFGYDSFNLYPATTTDPLGNKTRSLFDYTLGKPTKTTDPNGLITQNAYDGLDRVTQVQAPNLTTSSTQDVIESFVYTDTSGAVSVKDSKQMTATSTVDSYSYYDGLGRLMQSRSAGASSTFEVKDVSYNMVGLPTKESLPYFSAGTSRTTATTTSALFTNYTYDAMQRLKVASNVLGNATTTYTDWKTTITDPNGKTKDLFYDAYKRLIEVDEHNATSTYVTAYQYDGLGDLTKITDASNNVRNFTYDGLGRRLTAEDLHAVGDGTFGTWTYTYDDGGNLTTQVDPKSQTLNYNYDDLSRPLTEDYTGQAGTEVTYTYDSCAYGVGSLCTASSTAIRIVNTYNPRRLLASETKTIDGTNYATSYTYDPQGNQLTITNPDNSQIKYDYTGSHFLNKVSKKETTDGGFVSIVNSLAYAPNEQVSSIAFANGVTETNTYDPAKLYRLTRKISTLPSTSKAQDLTYTYDAVGNITQLVEAGATNTRRTVNYGYDDLYRLTSASATGTPVGIAGYTQTFTYDPLGNILTSDQGSYAYAGNVGSSYANPHAATTIGGSTLTYDNNGNVIGMTASAGGWSVNGGTWSRRRAITIDHTKVSGTSTLVNFPVLISNTDAEFKTVTNGGYVASSTGADIFFTSSDGSTKLKHEIESYASTTGALTAWVQVPSLSTSTDGLLYMYYGNASSANQQNATGTWDSYTKGVWHFNSTLTDSTVNANNGTNHSSTSLSSGKIGGARNFTGVWDTVSVSSSASLQPSTQITFGAWLNQSGPQPDYVKPMWYGQNIANPWGAYGFYLGANADNDINVQFGSTSTGYGTWPAASLTTSTWQYVVATYDGAAMKLYLDGNLIANNNAAFKIGDYNATSGLSFGSSWNLDADWTGYIDEARVASTTRSADWIKTEYNNQNAPATFSSLGAPSGSDWYLTGGTWNYRKPVIIDHTKVSPVSQTTLTDFPVLVSVTDANLKTTANGGKVGKTDGTDILFTLSDGVTKLSHEIESYTSTTGALVAWVRVPTLAPSTDTNLYLYFGNAAASDQQNKTGTWDGTTKGVWHFNNSLLDSTSNANNGTDHGTANLTNGKIGGARSFTGVWDTVTVANSTTLQPSTQFTLSTWINQSGAQPDYVKPIWYGPNNASPWGVYGLSINPNSDTAVEFTLTSTSTAYGAGPANLTTSTWQYLVGTYDGSTMKLYLDGNFIGSNSSAFKIGGYNTSTGLGFGSAFNPDADWNGSLDEIHVASTTRSADWIKTEFNNQGTSTMLTVGTMQASSTAVVVQGSGTSTGSTLAWDYLNRLSQDVGSGSTSTYSYDPSNERIKSAVTTSTGTTTTYYPTKFYNVTGSIPTKHVFANGVVIATIVGTGSSSTVSTILTDHLTGSNVVTNASGTITELADYYPYGATRIDDQSGFNEQRKFAGHEYDAATGLSYMDARYYHGGYGRFISEDPAFLNTSFDLSDPQSLNAYGYSRNNPLRYADPNGESIQDYVWGVAGYGVGTLQGAGTAALGILQAAAHPNLAAARGALYMASQVPQGKQLAQDLYNNPSKTVNEITTGYQISFNELLSKSSYEQGKDIGNVFGQIEVGAAMSYGEAGFGNATREINISRSAYPETAQHILDAQEAGYPSVLTIERGSAAKNRAAALEGHSRIPGKQLDEYPPAMFREGGSGASVRAVSPSDNMGAGACMGNQCRGLPNNTKVRVKVGN